MLLKNTITLFCGGDVNIGRRMHFLSKKFEPFVGIEEMSAADCRMVNLECVIGTHGEQSSVKHYFYLRARPEQTNILTESNIDIVTTANNHAGDYGRESLLEELGYLDKAGILHAGSGKNLDEALKPVYKRVGNITLAIFSVDSRKRSSAATNDTPGTAYLPIDKPKLWKEVLEGRIRQAHEFADVVIICPHWGENKTYHPAEETKTIAHLLIDIGADVVLGCHAHYFQGVENYKNRPIIYDAGDFLFDSVKRPAGCFNLEISADGVEKINFIPLIKDFGQTLKADTNQAKNISATFIELCKEFKTNVTLSDEGVVEIKFNPSPCESKVISNFADDKPREKHLIEPLTEPRPEWVVDKVPDEAIISPKQFGAIKLVGYYVPPECKTLTEPRMLYVETYWKIDEPFDKDCLLTIRGVPVRECDLPIYGQGKTIHEFLDYMWPPNRWKPGVIYREKFGLLPPRDESKLINVDLRIEITVTAGEEVLGEWKVPELIKMQLEGLLYHNTEFDDIIYHSEPGKCWTAEQLAKVTGGEWIVPPPKGWYAQSFMLPTTGTVIKPRPTLFLDMAKTEASNQKLLKNIERLDGAIIHRNFKGLPSDFPLLKVDSVDRAIFELGVAARKRFQGKVIAVTGSNGKTTTCNMLEHVLTVNQKITATHENRNLYAQIPWIFAHVNQDDDYAIIEMSLPSLSDVRGSITYDITPDVAIITSLAPAHLPHKNVGTLRGLAKYKSRIFCGMTAGSYAIINRDIPCYEIFEQRAKSFNLNIITFGTHEESTVRMLELKDDATFTVEGKSYKLACPVPSEQLYDALATVATSVALGIPFDKSLERLKTFTPVKGRGNEQVELPPTLNIPKPAFDVKDFLPEGITPKNNGAMPDDRLKKIHCGGRLYVDAARAWLAMVRAAAMNGVFLSVNRPSNVYRMLERQERIFKDRYTPLGEAKPSANAIRVEYDGEIWQLNPDSAYAAVPGTSSHGYGLAVDIQNGNNSSVKDWLSQNAESFGFVKEYDFKAWHYTYIKAREGLPARVLEIERLEEPTYTAKEIEQVSGGKWFTSPGRHWTCNGMSYKRPAKAGSLAVVRQDGDLGLREEVIDKIARQFAGFICTKPEPLAEYNRPILVVQDVKVAVKKLKDFFKA